MPSTRARDRDPVPRGRRMYEQGERRETIAATIGVSEADLAKLIRAQGWRRKRRVKPPVRGGAAPSDAAAAPGPGPGKGQSPATVPVDTERPARADLALSITQAVERELAAIDAVLARLGTSRPGAEDNPSDAERTARTLASLARALKELKQLDAGRKGGPQAEHDDMPGDIDEFRRELARRMDALVASRAEPGIPGRPG